MAAVVLLAPATASAASEADYVVGKPQGFAQTIQFRRSGSSVSLFAKNRMPCDNGKRVDAGIGWSGKPVLRGDRSKLVWHGSHFQWTVQHAFPAQSAILQGQLTAGGLKVSGTYRSTLHIASQGVNTRCQSPTIPFKGWLSGPFDFKGKTSQGEPAQFSVFWDASTSRPKPTRVTGDPAGINLDLSCPPDSPPGVTPFPVAIEDEGPFSGPQFSIAGDPYEADFDLPPYGTAGTATGTFSDPSGQGSDGCHLPQPVTVSLPMEPIFRP